MSITFFAFKNPPSFVSRVVREMHSIKNEQEHRNVCRRRRDDVSMLLKALHIAIPLPLSMPRSFRRCRYSIVSQVNEVKNAVSGEDAMDDEDEVATAAMKVTTATAIEVEVKIVEVKYQGFLTPI